jgi:transcriptional regulator with XRE-family HTH domain
MSTWSEYVHRITAGLTQMQIAERSGLGQSAISSWLNETSTAPKADYVVKLARAFNQNVIEALIVAGYITADEAKVKTVMRTPLSQYSTDELLDEFRLRAAD